MPEELNVISTPTPPIPEAEAKPAMTEEEEQQVIRRAMAQVDRMLRFRRQYDERFAKLYRQYVGKRDQKLFPDGITPRANNFVPYPFSDVETVVSRVYETFFGFENWFECRGRGAADEDAAEAMGRVLQYMLRVAGLPQIIAGLTKNIAIYGIGALKVDWNHGYDTVTYPKPEPLLDEVGAPIIDPRTGQPAVNITRATKQVPRARPKFSLIDIYDLLIDPDGGLAAHATERTYGELRREAETNPDLYLPSGLAELAGHLATAEDKDNILIRIVELWDTLNDHCTILAIGSDKEAIAWKDVRTGYRQGTIGAYKRKLYGGPAILLWDGPNFFAHKRCPILRTGYVKIPGEAYPMGVIESISELTESLNRFVNMITDNWNLGINRRYAYNTEMDIDHEALNNCNVPGGKVGMAGNPNEGIAPLPFFTPQAGDYAILDLYRGMIEMTAGISDFYSKGIGAPVGNRTATGITSIIQESKGRFALFVANLAEDILQPLLEMCASMVQQFCTDEVEIRITDAPPAIPKYLTVKPEELLGAFSWDLVAANYATNKFVRQRNMLALANLVGTSPYCDQLEAIRELAKVFEIPNANRLLKSPEQVAQEQQAAQAAQLEMIQLQHRMELEKIYFSALWTGHAKAELAHAKAQSRSPFGGKPGRPAKMQFEGKIPGAGTTSPTREFAQNLGANALGLEGLGEIPEI